MARCHKPTKILMEVPYIFHYLHDEFLEPHKGTPPKSHRAKYDDHPQLKDPIYNFLLL